MYGADTSGQEFTALRLGATYLQKDNYKATGRYEVRIGRHTLDQLASAGGSLKLNNDYTLFFDDRYFDSTYNENFLQVGAAYRPAGRDDINGLFKFSWKARHAELKESRFIGATNWNWRPQVLKGTDLMAQYAFKFVDVSDSGHSFTDMVRLRVMKDITRYLECGAHAATLIQHETGTIDLSWGVEAGVKVVKNVWLTLGYNFRGFTDKDFDDARAWAQGPYMKVRMKFDENTVKDVYDAVVKTSSPMLPPVVVAPKITQANK